MVNGGISVDCEPVFAGLAANEDTESIIFMETYTHGSIYIRVYITYLYARFLTSNVLHAFGS